MEDEYQPLLDKLSARVSAEIESLDARLGAAWRVLSSRKDTYQLSVNSEGTRMVASYQSGLLEGWTGPAQAVFVGTGLSTNSSDNQFSVSSVSLSLYDTAADAAVARNAASQITLQLNWVVEPDAFGFARTKSFTLQSLSAESTWVGLHLQGPLLLNVAANTVAANNSLLELRFGSSAADSSSLKVRLEGSFSVDLDTGSLAGQLSKIALYDEANNPRAIRDLTLVFNGLTDLETQVEQILIEPLRMLVDEDIPLRIQQFQDYIAAVEADLLTANPTVTRFADTGGKSLSLYYPLGSFGFYDGLAMARVDGDGLSSDFDDTSFDISSIHLRTWSSGIVSPSAVPDADLLLRTGITVRPGSDGAPDLKSFMLYEFSSRWRSFASEYEFKFTAPTGVNLLQTTSSTVPGRLELKYDSDRFDAIPGGKIFFDGNFLVHGTDDEIRGVITEFGTIEPNGRTRYSAELNYEFESLRDLLAPDSLEKILGGYLDSFIPPRTDGTTGHIYFWKGGTLLPDATLYVAGEALTKTGADGRYKVDGLAIGRHTVRGEKPIGPAEQGSAINSADALAALKIAVGRNPNAEDLPLSPYQLMAADVTKDGRVTSADALAILKMAVKRSDAPSREWMFVDERMDLWDAQNSQFHAHRSKVPTSFEMTASLDAGVRKEMGMVAILKGDVNGSWRPAQAEVALPKTYFTKLVADFPELVHPNQFGFVVV